MKRLVRNRSGEVSYGPKWQHTESSSDSENDDDHFHLPTITNQDQIPKGKRVEVTVKDGELMYLAALEGDWLAAEVLLERDRNLAFDYVTEEGDRALHVAAAMKREEFVMKLVERMSEEELALLDGYGYTACCYAAISGNVEIARLIIENRPNLVTARDEEKATPLRKAALQGNGRMLSFLLRHTKDEDLSREEWFDLLLVALRSKMFGVAIEIIGKNASIATMANEEEGTALHLLARDDEMSKMKYVAVDIIGKIASIATMADEEEGTALHLHARVDILNHMTGEDYSKRRKFQRLGKVLLSGKESLKMEPELTKKLWDEMLKMEKGNLVGLMEKPVHIVHEAAKTGQVEMITMITRSFPKLMWETDSNGHTIFHIAVMYRQSAVFMLVHQVEAMLGFRIACQDRDGNNILHLAASKSAAVGPVKLPPAFQIGRELEWFKAVKKIVPPSCVTMRNVKGLTPDELFSKTHKKLLKESKVWMTNRADALMLIATILLTVVFAAAFTVPGGYSSQTGEPVLGQKNWFKAFVVFEILSIMFSIVSIMMFQSIMASSFAQEEFLEKLPALQFFGFMFLLMSLSGAFLAFMASISLFNLSHINGLVWFGIVGVCIYGASFWMSVEIGDTDEEVFSSTKKDDFFKKTVEAKKI